MKKTTAEQKFKFIRLNIKVPEETYKAFRMLVFRIGMNMNSWVKKEIDSIVRGGTKK